MDPLPGRVSDGAVRQYTVVVGVSATSGSPAALGWAVEEARLRGGVVIALRAWRPPRPPAASGAHPPVPAGDSSVLFREAQQQLEADVAQVLGDRTGVECRLVHGGRRKALRSISRHADLMVIDAPRRTDLTSPPLFARRLLYSAGCPVVVMPPAVHHEPDTSLVVAGKRIGHGLLNAAGTAGRPGVGSPAVND